MLTHATTSPSSPPFLNALSFVLLVTCFIVTGALGEGKVEGTGYGLGQRASKSAIVMRPRFSEAFSPEDETKTIESIVVKLVGFNNVRMEG